MTEILTSAEMRALEQRAMARGAVTGAQLMARAGAGVVAALEDHWPELAARAGRGWGPAPRPPGYLDEDDGDGPVAHVLCGPGNNGGDGFVVARLLRERGWTVTVFAMETSARAPDAVAARGAWDGAVRPLTRASVVGAGVADLCVDGVFAIGLTRAPGGDLAEVLSGLSGAGASGPGIVAIDVPSGLDADSGRVPGGGVALPADLTVTFDSPKPGHVLADGPDLCGTLVVADIGLQQDREGIIDPQGGARIPRPIALRLLPSLPDVADARLTARTDRPPAARVQKAGGHKYDHGHVLVLTGPMGRTGAARLAARAALRVGAGLVSLAAPGSAMMECASQITALMLRRCDGADDLLGILENARFGALCLGPGLGARARELTLAALRADPARKLVLDADALTAFAEAPDMLFEAIKAARARGGETVLTPHTGEFARLFPDINAAWYSANVPVMSKLDAVRLAAERAGATVLLKGPDTVIATQDAGGRDTGRPAVAMTVHAAAYDRAAPWLATAGAGDVLAGFIAGLMARGMSGHEAAETAVWLHVECARTFGPGLIAEDLPEMVPRVLGAAHLG